MLGIIGCMDTPRGVHPKCQGLGTKGGRMGASGVCTNKHRQWQERQAMQAEDKPAPIAVTPQPAVM